MHKQMWTLHASTAQHAEKKAVMLCLPMGVADATLGAYMFELSKGKQL